MRASTNAHSRHCMVILFLTCRLLPAATDVGQTPNWYCLPLLGSTYLEVVENWQINCAGKFGVSNVEQISYV